VKRIGVYVAVNRDGSQPTLSTGSNHA
jgi:hypothetical protein